MNEKKPKIYYSVAEAVELTGISESALRQRMDRGNLAYVRIAGTLRIHIDSLTAMADGVKSDEVIETQLVEVINTREFSDHFGISDQTARTMVQRGELSAVRYGKLYLIDKREIERLENGQ